MAKNIPVIDTEACIACGNCEAVCPAVFRLNELWDIPRSSTPREPRKIRSSWPSTSVRSSASAGRKRRTEAQRPHCGP